MTSFGEISPLWQILKVVGKFVRDYFGMDKILNLLWQQKIMLFSICSFQNRANCWENNIAIWSYWWLPRCVCGRQKRFVVIKIGRLGLVLDLAENLKNARSCARLWRCWRCCWCNFWWKFCYEVTYLPSYLQAETAEKSLSSPHCNNKLPKYFGACKSCCNITKNAQIPFDMTRISVYFNC